MTIFFLAVQSYFNAGASMALNTPFPMDAQAMNNSLYLQNCQDYQLAAQLDQRFAGQMLGQPARELMKDK